MATAETVRRPGRPSATEAQRIDGIILDAAYRAFVELGYADATIEGIAATAQTTRRSVVHRYPTKDDLLVAVARRKLEATLLATVVRDEDMTEDLLDALHAALRRLLNLFLEPDMIGYCRLTMNETGRLPRLGELTIAWNEALIASYVRFILKAQKAGHFRRFSPRAIAEIAIGIMLSNPLNRTLLGDDKFAEPHQVDLYFSEMWAILVALA